MDGWMDRSIDSELMLQDDDEQPDQPSHGDWLLGCLPVIVQPQCDVDAGYGLSALFVDRTGDVVGYTTSIQARRAGMRCSRRRSTRLARGSTARITTGSFVAPPTSTRCVCMA
eukprot:TRINITY_DN66434_c5_g1_i1.p2 TRINITY_DN66434_c5_g1~~TRINITY_DN66434_c5_g1_i1.p2  ORF type:complete len:113 (-),score=17.98 TRINITY_DN66434_c5_g1_i1:581-919(-)